MERKISYSPLGEAFFLPDQADYQQEKEKVLALAREHKQLGYEIVAVLGLGFVGAAMAAIVAESEKGKKYVFGVQRPSERSFWKVPLINRGLSPLKSEDPQIDLIFKQTVLEKKNLYATYVYEILELADVIIVDTQLDFLKNSLNDVSRGEVVMADFEKAMEIIGKLCRPEALILIETTVPPGTTEQIALPAIRQQFKKRAINQDPLLAHSYERVMPGKNYYDSIKNFWRVVAGINEESTRRAVSFLSSVINVEQYPLTVLDAPIESETAKIIENSYRAMILAFMNEWTLFAERNGIDIVKVLQAIKVRPTHSNIILPGIGIGGYCLPKDGALGVWAYEHLLGFNDQIFNFTPQAINVNDSRPLYAARVVREALKEMQIPISRAEILVLGASYREDVGDTRHSGSEILVRRLTEMGAEVRVHDFYVDKWWEFVRQKDYPPAGKGRYFRNQEKLENLEVEKDLPKALSGINALVFAVPHRGYFQLQPEELVKLAGNPFAVIDCCGMLSDEKIIGFLKLGCEVQGLGRGHIKRLKSMLK